MDLSRPRETTFRDWTGPKVIVRGKLCPRDAGTHTMVVGHDDNNRVQNNLGKHYLIELMLQVDPEVALHLFRCTCHRGTGTIFRYRWDCSYGTFHNVAMGTVLLRCFSRWRVLLNRVRKLQHPCWINRRNESMVHLSWFMLSPSPRRLLEFMRLSEFMRRLIVFAEGEDWVVNGSGEWVVQLRA